MLEQADSSSTPRTLQSQRIKAPRRPARTNSLKIIVYKPVHNYVHEAVLLLTVSAARSRLWRRWGRHHTGEYCELIYYVNLIVCILESLICNSFFFLVYWLVLFALA